MKAPVDDQDLCEICDDRIEDPRRAVGLTSCWPCAAADPRSPPWDIEPADADQVPA